MRDGVQTKIRSSWHWAAFTHSDAIMQFQRKSIEKLFIGDKLSQAIKSGLLRVNALELRKIYEKVYRKLTAYWYPSDDTL